MSDTSNNPNVEETVLPSEPVQGEATEAPSDDEKTTVEAPDAPKQDDETGSNDPDAGMRHE